MKNISPIETRMTHLVNNERVAKGLKILKVSPLLCHIARLHSKVQLQHRSIFHESPVDGSDHGQRIEAGGYLSKSSAENVSTAPTLEMSHSGLMKSPGHYKNIVGDWEEIGIGIEKDTDGQLYVTQLFANPAKLVNIDLLKARILEGIFHYRKNNNLNPVSHISSANLQKLAELPENKIDDGLFKSALKELSVKGAAYQQALIFQFSGFSNPNQDDQMKLASRPDLKVISLAFHQGKKDGVLKGVFLFLI